MRYCYIILLLSFFISSCTDNRAPSGIHGTVLYGQGDCTSPVDPNNRVYSEYSGKVWVVEKSVIDTMNIIQFDSTKSDYLSADATEGQFSLLVPPGTYYVIIDTLFYISSENLITLEPDDLLEREFKFYRCL